MFSVGALLGLAVAESKGDHYHTVCNDHGMVHGDSTNDSIYHGRMMRSPCRGVAGCEVGQFHDPAISYAYTPAGISCDVMLRGYGPECAGWGGGSMYARVGRHPHQAHSPCYPPFPAGTPIGKRADHDAVFGTRR
jgi:hypothetical protein